jgi:hypothetical protein
MFAVDYSNYILCVGYTMALRGVMGSFGERRCYTSGIDELIGDQ